MYWKGSTSASRRSRVHSVSLDDGFSRKGCANPGSSRHTTTGPLVNAPAALFQNKYQSSLPFIYMNFAHKYVLFIKGDTLDEVAEEALHLVYVFVMRALQEHRSQGRNGDYEAFALQLLAMLQRYRYLYTNPPQAPLPDWNN